MKEIDFLPDWYRSDKRRRMSYRTQYVTIAVIMTAMAGWSFITARSVSQAQAQTNMSGNDSMAQSAREYVGALDKISQCRKEVQLISRLDSRVNVASVMAELSHVVEGGVVLLNLSITAEPVQKDNEQNQGNGMRAAAKHAAAGTMEGQERFRLVLGGYAADAADVARLIRRLEESPYFVQVIPGFSRTRTLKEKEVSEFEISCYLGNLVEDKAK
jgi:hypothetical protein